MTEEVLNLPAKAPTPDLKTARKHFSRLGLSVLLIFVAGTLLQVLFSLLAEKFAPQLESHSWGMWIITFVPLYLMGMPLGMLLMRTVPVMPMERKSLKITHFLWFLPVSICMMYAGNLLGNFLTGIIRTFIGLPTTNPVESLIASTGTLPRILFVVLLGPIAEELVFRKFLIDRMAPYGEKLAVFLSALMFGLFHGNLSQLFYAFALGLVFGYVYLRTRKLRYSALLHMFINFIGGVVGPLLLEKIGDLPTDLATLGAQEIIKALPGLLILTAYSMAMMATAVVGLILLCVNLKKLFWKGAPKELPLGTEAKISCLNAGMIALGVVLLSLIIYSLF